MSRLWVWCPLHQNFTDAMMVCADEPKEAALKWAAAYTIHHSSTVYTVHVEPYPNPEHKLVHRFEVHGVNLHRFWPRTKEPKYFATEIKPVRNSHAWDPRPPDEYVRWQRFEEQVKATGELWSPGEQSWT